MGIFDLVLIISVLLSLVTLLIALGLSIARRWRSARRLLAGWGIYIAAYLTVVIVVSWLLPPRRIRPDEDVCFDDWCIAVEHIEHGTAPGSSATCRIPFRLTSRARRRPQREHNLHVYLLDAHGERLEATVPNGEPAFDTLLVPGETVRTIREFDLPLDVTPDRLVITHQGGFPIGWFIIGEGPFSKGAQLALR
jgi:uncharacterized SAM-binding protein YcdF (DUF218 family)